MVRRGSMAAPRVRWCVAALSRLSRGRVSAARCRGLARLRCAGCVSCARFARRRRALLASLPPDAGAAAGRGAVRVSRLARRLRRGGPPGGRWGGLRSLALRPSPVDVSSFPRRRASVALPACLALGGARSPPCLLPFALSGNALRGPGRPPSHATTFAWAAALHLGSAPPLLFLLAVSHPPPGVRPFSPCGFLGLASGRGWVLPSSGFSGLGVQQWVGGGSASSPSSPFFVGGFRLGGFRLRVPPAF
jgi:hypothetical protein